MVFMLFMARKNAPTSATARHFDRRGKALVHSTPDHETAVWVNVLPSLKFVACVVSLEPLHGLPSQHPLSSTYNRSIDLRSVVQQHSLEKIDSTHAYGSH